MLRGQQPLSNLLRERRRRRLVLNALSFWAFWVALGRKTLAWKGLDTAQCLRQRCFFVGSLNGLL